MLVARTWQLSGTAQLFVGNLAGIISILAAILLPALARAKETAPVN